MTASPAQDVRALLDRLEQAHAAANGRVHELKTWPGYFNAVAEGRKTYELRRDDRGYAVGDLLRLREWTPSGHAYTGREVERLVTHVLRAAPGFGLADGFVLLSLAVPSLVSALRAVADLADELEDEADTALEKYPSNPFDVPIVRDIRAAAGSQKFTATRIRDALAAALSPTEVRP
jgi:hypothetical protein